VEAPWAVAEFDIEAKVAAVADIEEPTVVAAVVASLAFVQQRDPFASFAAAAAAEEVGKDWSLPIVQPEQQGVKPMATWRLVLQELIVVVVVVVAAVPVAAAAALVADAVLVAVVEGGDTQTQPLEASVPQTVVTPPRQPAADIPAAHQPPVVSPSLRGPPRLNRCQIHRMDWMEGRMMP